MEVKKEALQSYYFLLSKDIAIEIMDSQDFEGMHDSILDLFSVLYSNLLHAIKKTNSTVALNIMSHNNI